MPARDVSAYLPLHPLELRVLLAVRSGARHGYAIVREIEGESSSGGRIYPANLYRRIRNLLTRGLLDEATAPAGAPAERRTYLRLTVLGDEVARAEAHRLERLVTDVRAAGLLDGERPA